MGETTSQESLGPRSLVLPLFLICRPFRVTVARAFGLFSDFAARSHPMATVFLHRLYENTMSHKADKKARTVAGKVFQPSYLRAHAMLATIVGALKAISTFSQQWSS